MVVPTLDELHRPVLKVADASNRRLSPKDFLSELTAVLSITDTDMKEMLSSGQSRVENRIGWAMTSLKKAGLLNNPERGQWEITQKGRDFLMKHQGNIKLIELEKMRPESSNLDPAPITSGTATPDEQMDQNYKQHEDKILGEISAGMKSVSPSNFEHLVVKLLSRMGYGDGERVGKSGDQGIDGILSKDPLELENVYVQAKQYKNTNVGSPDIRSFAGSLDAKGANKGVFITTSDFTQQAKQNAEDISKGSKLIHLINGDKLAELMIEYDLGVVTEKIYKIKKLDANVFESDT